MVKKDKKWDWTEKQKEVFRKLKERFTKKPVLAAPDLNKKMRMEVDASDYATGVMNLFLRVGNKNNSCIRETQENSIEFQVQSSLPYILIPMVRANYCAPYPK